MLAVVTSVIAVLGTLAGAALNHAFGRRGAIEVQAAARADWLRRERLAACSEFAALAVDLRRAGNDLWHRREFDPDSEMATAATGTFGRTVQP